MYEPHVLWRKVSNVTRNEYNEIVESRTEWERVCACRCDDNTTKTFATENGGVFVPSYHIVCDRCGISEGEEVKVTDNDGNLRGGGKVVNAPKCNYLGCMSIYV